jgi:hypothetical protein
MQMQAVCPDLHLYPFGPQGVHDRIAIFKEDAG